MMFLQRYVHVVLDAVLGSYVKNIDPEALKISVWNGKIEIDVVELLPDALPLPPEFRVVKATLHQVRIDLPWSNLANQPIRVDVQDVNVLLEVCDRRPGDATNAPPSSHGETKDSAAKRRAEKLKRKRATIDAIEKATRASKTSSPPTAENSVSKTVPWTQSLLFKLLVKVLDNVQLNVQHIHLRVEDRVSAPSRPFAVGVTLESMVIKSADAGWNYTMIVRGAQTPRSASAAPGAASFLRKKIDINKFGLYWSLPLTPVPPTALEDAFAFMRVMQMNFWSEDATARASEDARYPKLFEPSDYVIEPLTLSLKLTVNDGRAKLPITHAELCSRVMTRLGTPWKVQTIAGIGNEAWQEFVKGMPKLAGGRMYTLTFVFSEAWAVAREQNEEEDMVPSVDQFKVALASCLQWSLSDVDRLEASISKYRDAVIHVLQEKSTYIDASASVDHISVAIQRQQYLSGLNLISFLGVKRQQARYAKLRPVGVRVVDNPRRWWAYAISAVLLDVRERLARVDTEELRRLKSRHERFKDLYLVSTTTSQHGVPPGLVSPDVAQLSKETAKLELEELEVELDIQEMLRLRRSARQTLVEFASKPRPAPVVSHATTQPSSASEPAAPASSSLWNYTSWLYGGGTVGKAQTSSGGSRAETSELEWSDQDTKLFFDAIDYDPEDVGDDEARALDSQARAGEHIWYRCQFSLSKTSLRLLGDENDVAIRRSPELQLAAVSLDNVDFKVLVRPASVELGIKLGDASVFGLSNPRNDEPRIVVERMQVDEIVTHHPASISDYMSCVQLRYCEQVLPLIDVSIEVKKVQRKTSLGIDAPSENTESTQGIAVSVVAQAMKCDVDVEALLHVGAFLARPSNVDLTGLRDRAWRQAQNLQRYSAAQVHAALARRSNVELLIDVISPLITLRESPHGVQGNGVPTGEEHGRSRLVVFLGHLRAASRRGDETMGEIHGAGGETSLLASTRNEDHLYDVIDVGLSAIEVRLSDGEDASSISTQLLEKTSVHISISVSIAPNDPTVALVKVVGGVDSVQVNLDTKTFALLVRLLRSIGDDFSRVRVFREASVGGTLEEEMLSTRDPIEANLEVSAAISHDDENFFSGFESDTKFYSQPSMSRSVLRRSVTAVPSSPASDALYGVLSRVRDMDRPGSAEKEIADSDLLKLWRRILLLVRFQIREVAITLNLASKSVSKSLGSKAVRVCMSTVETELDIRTYDKQLRFAVGSFSVEERRDQQPNRFLIASGDLIDGHDSSTECRQNGQLIRLSISSVDTEAPKPKDLALWPQLRDDNGSTDGQSMDQSDSVWQDPLVTWLSVDARLRTLVLNLHQDAFADFFLFFYQSPRVPAYESPPVGSEKNSASNQASSGSGRARLVRKVAKAAGASEKSAPNSTRIPQRPPLRRGLTSKISTWVATSLAERMSARRLPVEMASTPPSTSTIAVAPSISATMQLRLHVAGLSVVLHQPPVSGESTDSVFIRLEAKDFSCCIHRFPEFMSVYAYLVSMRISDETVPDPSLREILGSENREGSNRALRSPSQEISAGHIPTVDDILRAVDDVPAIFSCAAQLYGADRIQEQWHPGYANRFSVRLNSPRIRVLYRFLDDLRSYFVDGVLLQTVMTTLFPHRVQVAWDPEFLVSSFSSQHVSSAPHGASPRAPFTQMNATSDVVSMFPLLDVWLVDAKLHIPVHRASTEALVVRFDSFHLSNEYLLDMFKNMNNRVMAKVLLNSSLCQLKMDLNALRVVSVILVDSPVGHQTFHQMSGQSGRPELLTQSLLGSTSMTVSADFSSGNATTIGIEFTPVRLVCNREQYAFLLRLPIQNFGEARRRSPTSVDERADSSSTTAQPASSVRDDEIPEEGERELVLTVKVPEFAIEILHGQEGYQPSTSGDMSMAETEKRADGSICLVDVTMFSAALHYGFISRSVRVSSEMQGMRIRDTRLDAQISSSYRDVIVFTPPSVSGVSMPSISIRVLHGTLDASDQQERALECSFASPHRRRRPQSGSQESSSRGGRNLRKMSSSFFGSDTLVGLHPPRRASSISSAQSFGFSKSVDSDGTSDHTEPNVSTPKASTGERHGHNTSVRTDVIVDVEGFRVIPSNIHYDVLRFLESPGRGTWDSESLSTENDGADESVEDQVDAGGADEPDMPRAEIKQHQHYVVVALTLGKSAVLLVEDPSKLLSRAVMFSWEASIMVEFLRRPTVIENSSSSHRLQVRVDLTNIQATSRLSQENMWARGSDARVGASTATSANAGDIAGDFLKPCDLECRLDVDFASGFVRLKTAFDRVLELRFGYLDVCSLRSAIERIIAYPSSPSDSAPTSSSAALGRRFSVGSSIGSSSSALVPEADGVTMTSVAALSEYGDTQSSNHRRRRRDRSSEPMLQYGTTLVYLVSATFRGPLNVRPAIGLYSSPWRKRYLVLPFTAQERQSVEPTMFRIVPAVGSRRSIGDPIRFGDRIALETVHTTPAGEEKKPAKSGEDGDELDSPSDAGQEINTVPICKYDQLGASGYLGPDGSAGVFETRIWKYGTSAFNSDRGPIRHKDAIVLEELTIYRAFSKGKSFYGTNRLVSAQFDLMDNGDNARMGSEGGGYLMFNGVGDAPIPFVVSVKSSSTTPIEVGTPPASRSKVNGAPTSTRSQPPQVPTSTGVGLWQKLKVFQFNLPGVNATVVNDFHNMLLPLLHLRVVQLTLDLRGSFDSRLTAMASLQVGIQNYNSQLAVWEPLVEDFDVNAAIHLKGGAICDFCMSDRKQISVAGTKLRCEGIPNCLFGATKTVAFAPAAARASETKHFIYQELLNHHGAASTSGNHDDDAKLVTTCLLVIKKGINVNISRTGINVLLQFVDLVSRAASNAEQDAWRSRLGAFVYVDNQSGIPFMVAGHPSTSPPVSSSSSTADNFGAELNSRQSSVDDSGDDMVKLPTLSVGSEEGLLGLGSGGVAGGIGTSALEPTSWINNKQLTAVMKDMMASSTTWLTVNDGQRVATSIVAHEAPAGSVASPLRRLLWLRPKSSSSSSKPIPVPIGYSNRSYVHLESRSGFKDPWHGESIICETVAEQGTLVMRLRGKVQLVNHLSFPVEVVYNDQRREVLAADARSPHFVPIQYLDGGNMTLSPILESGQLQRSTHLSIASLLRAPVLKMKKTSQSIGHSGSLEVRKVLTFYWDVHPDEPNGLSSLGGHHEDFGVSRPPFQLILTASRKSEKHEAVLTISPPIRLENLVPYALAFRTVCTKSERDLAWVKDNAASFSGTSDTVASGHAAQICELEIFNDRSNAGHDSIQVPAAVALSIAIPGIGYETFSALTESSFIYGSDRVCSRIELTKTGDDNGFSKEMCPLLLRVEIVTTERLGTVALNRLAPSVCRIYAEYWLIDRTCLSLVMRTPDGRRVEPWVSSVDAPKSHAPVALFSSQKEAPINQRIKIGVQSAATGGSDIQSSAFDISTVGLRGQIKLRSTDRGKSGLGLSSLRMTEVSASPPALNKQFDIGVMIEQGPSIFSRTTVVTFVPRYYFINTSDRFQIMIKQERDVDMNAVSLAPRQGCFFHWNDSRLRNRVQIRFVCLERECNGGIDFDEEEKHDEGEDPDCHEPHGTSEWSLPFEVTSVGNFVVRLHRALSRASTYFGDSCFASDEPHPNDSASSSPYVGQCEVLTGMSLHVGVELHDPAFVVRFHEGRNSVSAGDPAFDGGAVDAAQVKDFVSYKLKNECTALELFVWQKIPADAHEGASSASAFSFEGGDRVFPFQTIDFVPFSASTAPVLHVQLQTVLESASSLHNNSNDDEDEDGDDATISAGGHIAGVAPPRIVSSFEVALDKLHSLPVIEVNDGKTTKRLWVEVVLEDATKTLRVTDVLPGASGEHRRRRRTALLRSWKRYNASVLWYSRLLFDSNNKLTLPENDLGDSNAPRGEQTRQKKQVRFANEESDLECAEADANDLGGGVERNAEEAAVTASRPALIVAMRIVDALHLEDLYPPETNASGVSPFLRARMRGNQQDASVVSRTLRTQSMRAVFPRWVPAKYARRKRSENESDSEILLQRFSLDLDGESEIACAELELREGNKLLIFGSSVLGRATVPLGEILAAAREGSLVDQANQQMRVQELLVPLEPTSVAPASEIRSMVRIQLAVSVCRDPRLSAVTLEEAIRNYSVEAQLDRLVRCKSQLKVLLERESVDLSLSEGTTPRPTSPTTSIATPPGSQSQQQQTPTVPAPVTRVPSASEFKNSTRGSTAPSIATDDSGSDAANDIMYDERVLSVVVMGVTNLQIASSETDESDEDGPTKTAATTSAVGDQKVYCTVSYRESTRAATSSIAKRSSDVASAPPEENRQRRFVRTHRFTKGQTLGLDLIYHSGRVVVQGVACNGPCGKLLQDGEICIGDTIVAVNDKSIVNLHRDASFRTIAQACSVVGKEQQPTFSLSFLRQAPASFGHVSTSRQSQDESDVHIPRYDAEWNRRVEFVDSHRDSVVEAHGRPEDNKRNKVLVRVYRRNELSDHGLTAAQESSVVPFLYFFGDEDTMDHLDHSKEDTRFDTLLGEAWVSVPAVSSSLSGTEMLVSEEDQEPIVTECLCALYAPTTRSSRSAMTDHHFMSTARPMVGQVRLALKWEHRNSLAQLRNQQQLRTYVQLEVHGVFISIIDDGTGGTQRRPPREVLSISLSARHAETGIQVSYGLVTDGRHVVNTRIGHLQVDNQLLDTNYPVMVFPIRLDDTVQQEQSATTSTSPSNGGGAASSAIPNAARRATMDSETPRSDRILLPTFQLMGVFSKRRTLVQFEYIFVQLQEMDVKLEDAVLVATAQALNGINWALLGYGHGASERTDKQNSGDAAIGDAALSLVDARWPFPSTPEFPLSMMNVEHRGGSTKVLLRWLLFCPIKMNVTFTSTTDRANLLSLLSPEMSTVLRTMISAAAALVSNLDNAAIKVPEFYVENLLETTHTLAFYTVQHYVHHGLRSWYRIVGSVDFLGNPIGLVSALGTGVKDFFYTPAQMLLEDEDGLRIENLRTGMTKGSKSLFRNTAVGIFHTTGKITETLGKGIALLAMDDEYNVERQRQTTRQNKKINDLGGAIAEGGKGFVGGVWDGVKGVVAAPVRGAERDGAGGFVIGIGQGMAGLFVKPAAGFLDMLTSLSRGAKSSAEAIDGGYEHGYMTATRVRLPRRICADGVLVSYSEREARGCAILALTSLYLTDDYVFHLDYGLEAQRGILVLTDKRIICLSTRSGQKLWEVALDSSLHVETTGALLNIAQSKTSNRVYKIECEDETAASNFKLAVSSARLDLSATRYLLLNLEKKQDEARQNALLGVVGSGDTANGYDEDGRVDLSLLMGNLQDPMVSGLSEEELRAQPLRSVQVELCHLENTDAAASVPQRAIDRVLSFSVYQILVYGGPYQWTVYRRFSEFRELYAALEKTGYSLDPLPPLPGRTFLPSTRSAVATHRQEALSVFLEAAIMHSSISGSQAMLEFLTRSAHEIRVSLPPLSPTAALGMGRGGGAGGGGGGGASGGGGTSGGTSGIVGAVSTSGILRTP